MKTRKLLYGGFFFLLLYNTNFSQIEPNKQIRVGDQRFSIESVRISDSAKANYQFLNPLPQGNDLRYVKIFNQNEAAIIGVRGTFLKTTNAGMTWEVKHYVGGNSGTGLGLYGNFININYGLIVGGGRTIAMTSNSGLTWDDQTYNVQTQYDPMTRLYGCAQADSVNAWAVGYGGNIFYTSNNGASWICQSSGTSSPLFTTHFINNNLGYAAGDGVILKTTNKGVTWFNPEGSGSTPDSQKVLSFKMDEDTGNILYDSSLYNNNGTVVGNVPIVPGKYGNARSFSGGSYIKVTNSASLGPTSAITVECWVNTSNLSYGTLVRKSDGGQVPGYMLFLDSNGKPAFALIRSSAPIYCYGQTAIQQNTWTHVAGTFDGNQLKIYINGILSGSVNYSGLIEQGNSPLGIGAIPRTSGNDPFTGLIDEVKIYNYAKTSFDIGTNNANVLTLNMDEGSGNVLSDLSGFNNNGTTLGTVSIVSGKYGNARSFTGGSSGSYVNVNNSQSISPANAITVECWVNPTNITQSVSIIRKSNGGQVAGYQLALYYQGKITFQLIRSTTPITVTGNTPLTPNIWTHIAGTYDGNTLKVFVNGVLDGTTDYIGTIEQSTSPLGIGAVPRTYNNDGFSGLIDEVKIFNYAKVSFNMISQFRSNNNDLSSAIYYGIHFIDPNIGVVVGSSGTILKTTTGGQSWISQNSGTTLTLNGVFFINSNIGFAVGQQGYYIKTTNGGTTWIQKNSEINLDFQSVSFTNDGYGYTVGLGGVILYSSDYGETWTKQSIGTTNTLFSISFGNQLVGAAVGENGIILKTNNGGVDWFTQTSDITSTLLSVDFSNADYGTAVGIHGKIIHTTDGGNNWLEQISGVSNSLKGVVHINQDTIFAVGNGGLILYSSNSGSVWSQKSSGTTQELRDITFSDRNNGTIVGSAGTILRTTNGGQTWYAQPSGTTSNLNAVHFYNSNIGAIVTTDHTYFSLHTTNGGQTWEMKYNLAGDAYNDIYCPDENTYLCVSDVGAVTRAINNGDTYIDERSVAANPLYGVEVVPTSSGYVVYTVGQNGMILATVYSPMSGKSWTGSVDSTWDNPNNWSPVGVPSIRDSVNIDMAIYNPVINTIHQQIAIGALNIRSGGKLRITDAVRRFIIISDANISGTLELSSLATTAILVGGDWSVGDLTKKLTSLAATTNLVGGDRSMGGLTNDKDAQNLGFIPGNSTVQFDGQGKVFGSFYNSIFNLGSNISSLGNIITNKYCTVNDILYLRSKDTLVINDNNSGSLTGSAKIMRGTIKRTIEANNIENYRFESKDTYVKFNSGSVFPEYVTMTNYPDTNSFDFGEGWIEVPSTVDITNNIVTAEYVNAFDVWAIGEGAGKLYKPPNILVKARVRRVYAGGSGSSSLKKLTGIADGGFNFKLSLRYDQSEVELGADETKFRLLRLVTARLPVELVVFTYRITGKIINLIWHTATESNNYGFEVEKTFRDEGSGIRNWEKIGFVKGNGNSNSPKEYSFEDKEVTKGKRSYRLKQLDNDGNYGYSEEVEVEINMPTKFSLAQNYPNPFNPVTKIKYALISRELVVINVYDVLGKEVAKLVNEVKDAGFYTVEFNEPQLSSGVYFYRVQAGNFNDTKKMILLR